MEPAWRAEGSGGSGRLCEDEDQHHPNVHLALLGHRPHARVARDTNRHPCREAAHAAAQAGAQVRKPCEEAVANLRFCGTAVGQGRAEGCEGCRRAALPTTPTIWLLMMTAMMRP